MYTLILIISLKSQFNHALDANIKPGFATEQTCVRAASTAIGMLKSFNESVEAKYSCLKTVQEAN